VFWKYDRNRRVRMKRFFIILVATMLLITAIIISCTKDDANNGDNNGTGSKDPVCGNGVVDGDEVCDGDTVSCWKVGHYYPETNAKCKEDCSGYDTKNCIARDPQDKCGNGEIDYGETCEMGDTKPCVELEIANNNFVGGDASCRRDCKGWDPTNCESAATGSCAQLITCSDSCSDDNCIEACMAQGTDQGKEKFNALYTCWKDTCPTGADKEECMIRECFDEYYECFPTKRCGNGVIDDGEVCEKGETKPCDEMGEEWRPINEAICNSTCTAFDTYSCINVNDLTCYEVYECVDECGAEDDDCQKECTQKTFAAAKNIYDTMVECYEEKCPSYDDACIDENCKFQTDKCKTHLTCGNTIIDMYEVCEKGETVDCGTIEDSEGEPMYEAGTAKAFCNPNCTEWDGMMCYKFCSCPAVRRCVEQECGEYKDADSDCIKECEDLGSHDGKKEHAAWRNFVESCCETDQAGNPTACGFEAEQCIKEANKEFPCNTDTPHDKCSY
jgi:hypothetical protein